MIKTFSMIAISAIFLGSSVYGDDLPVVNLSVADGLFSPTEIVAPVGTKFKLVVQNNGRTAEEFESYELNREKVVAPGQKITIFLGPLPAGSYPFFGEFHPKTANGILTIK